MPCRLSVPSGSYSGMVLNVSRGGLFVQTSAGASPGDAVHLDLAVDEAQPVPVDARVVWRRVVAPHLRTVSTGGIGVHIQYASDAYFGFVACLAAAPGEEADAAPRAAAAADPRIACICASPAARARVSSWSRPPTRPRPASARAPWPALSGWCWVSTRKRARTEADAAAAAPRAAGAGRRARGRGRSHRRSGAGVAYPPSSARPTCTADRRRRARRGPARRRRRSRSRSDCRRSARSGTWGLPASLCARRSRGRPVRVRGRREREVDAPVAVVVDAVVAGARRSPLRAVRGARAALVGREVDLAVPVVVDPVAAGGREAALELAGASQPSPGAELPPSHCSA